jgi:hypothetical protein
MFNRLLLSVILAVLIRPSVTLCADGYYTGISDELPTGSLSISAEGLVAAYDFETFTGNGLLRDFGPYKNHGKVKRNNMTEGLFGNARAFLEVTDRVDLPEHSSFDLDGPLTIATWIQITTLNLHQHIFACDDKFVLWITENNQYRLADTQGQAYTTDEGVVQSGDWHSVVAVFYGTRGNTLSGDIIKIFVDGKPTKGSYDSKWAPTSLYPSDACYIGFESHHGSKGHQKLQFEGVIDEFLVFSRGLTPGEIQAHATRPPSK